MREITRLFVEQILKSYGTSFFLSRVADPVWFETFSLATDSRSAGQAFELFKRALQRDSKRNGILIYGGARLGSSVLNEILGTCPLGKQAAIDLVRTAQLALSVDSALVHDGYHVVSHGLFCDARGEWVIINEALDRDQQLRRYHWYSRTMQNPLSDPHHGVYGLRGKTILNLTHPDAGSARDRIVSFARQDLTRSLNEIRRIVLTSLHEKHALQLDFAHLSSVLQLSSKLPVANMESLLSLTGVGAGTMRMFAGIVEVLHGVRTRFLDAVSCEELTSRSGEVQFSRSFGAYHRAVRSVRAGFRRAKISDTKVDSVLRRLDQVLHIMEDMVASGKKDSQVKEREMLPLFV